MPGPDYSDHPMRVVPPEEFLRLVREHPPEWGGFVESNTEINPPFVPVWHDLVTRSRVLPTKRMFIDDWKRRAQTIGSDPTDDDVRRVAQAWNSLFMEYHMYSLCSTMAGAMGFASVYKSERLDVLAGIDTLITDPSGYQLGLRWWWGSANGYRWRDAKRQRAVRRRGEYLAAGGKPFPGLSLAEEDVFDQPLDEGEPEVCRGLHLYRDAHVVTIRDVIAGHVADRFGTLRPITGRSSG